MMTVKKIAQTVGELRDDAERFEALADDADEISDEEEVIDKMQEALRKAAVETRNAAEYMQKAEVHARYLAKQARRGRD